MKLPALKAQRFTQGFYLLNLAASDVRLVAIGTSRVHEHVGDTEERGDKNPHRLEGTMRSLGMRGGRHDGVRRTFGAVDLGCQWMAVQECRPSEVGDDMTDEKKKRVNGELLDDENAPDKKAWNGQEPPSFLQWLDLVGEREANNQTTLTSRLKPMTTGGKSWQNKDATVILDELNKTQAAQRKPTRAS